MVKKSFYSIRSRFRAVREDVRGCGKDAFPPLLGRTSEVALCLRDWEQLYSQRFNVYRLHDWEKGVSNVKF